MVERTAGIGLELGLGEQQRVVDGDRRAPGQLDRKQEIVLAVAVPTVRPHQSDGADRPSPCEERHDDRRSKREPPQDRQQLVVTLACLDQELIGDLGKELGLLRPQDLRDAARRVEVGRIAVAELLRPRDEIGIGVRNRKPLELRPVVAEHVDRTPVREPRHRQPGDLAQGLSIVTRRGQHLAGLREKAHPPPQLLFRREQPGSIERLRHLPRERQFEPTPLRVELLVLVERERQATERPAVDDQRQADERVRAPTLPGERRELLVAFRRRTDEHRLAAQHRARERQVVTQLEALPLAHRLLVEAPPGDDLEPLAPVVEQRDQPCSCARGRHPRAGDGIENLLGIPRPRELLRQCLEAIGLVEGVVDSRGHVSSTDLPRRRVATAGARRGRSDR